MDSDTKKIIVLAALAIILLIVALYFIFTNLFGDTEQSEAPNYASFPVSQDGGFTPPPAQQSASETAGIVNPPASTLSVPPTAPSNQNSASIDSDWRDEVVLVSEPTTPTAERKTVDDDTPPPSIAEITTPPQSLLNLQGVTYGYSPNIQIPPELLNSGFSPELHGSPAEYVAGLDELIPPYNPNNEQSQDCGSTLIPSSQAVYQDFVDDLSEKSPVVCMGQAIANDCQRSEMQVMVIGGTMLGVYLAVRPDGKCSLGIATDTEDVLMCELTPMLNSALPGSQSLTAWKADFAAEPGELFAALYVAAAEKGVLGDIDDCILYGL